MKGSIYLFSGLGADERAFSELDLNDYNVHHIRWVPPKNKESIAAYAQRICVQILAPSPILIGLSFGGIMAIEVSKLIPCKKTILISSVKTRLEIPWYYRWIGKTGLHRIIPTSFFKSANLVTYWAFGLKSKEEKSIFKTMLKDSDPIFMRWAIHQILSWKNMVLLSNLVHIHGTNDKILPLQFIKNTIKIEAGGHFMIWNQADKVSLHID